MEKQTFGIKIAALRKERGMTQAELAEKMGVTDKAVSKWERDLSYPDVALLPRLAELFGISVDELMQSGENANETGKDVPKHSFQSLLLLMTTCIPLAMGVAVTVLSFLKQLSLYSGFGLLGIGLASVALHLLIAREK
ncbi:MAG: helix-turn-helix transcriptional regulator [Clostridia bacterium]|nr:helix-turn-helix transcriptional regulator [Clostridia bacterium]